MNIESQKLEKIRAFANRGQKVEEQYTRNPLSSDSTQQYNRKLDETIRSLQDHVKRQEDALRELRASKQGLELTGSEIEPMTRLAQARRVKRAYDSLLQSEPDLPAPDSPLQSLIALRETSRVILESKASVLSLQESLPSNRQLLKDEEEDLRDAKLITSGLQDRIKRVESEHAEKSTKSPSQLASELIKDEQKKSDELKRATAKLKKALDRFIDDNLASMLAAEDLGGPVVGDVMGVPDSTLEAGYTHHGKPKKPKTTAQDDDEDRTQQRIDQIFRSQRQQQGDAGDDDVIPRNKREAAAAAMRTLLDSLLEAGMSYVELSKESAVSRFLVRAKVAQLHPRDARKIRLIDFGRTLED
ncbi:hypothetical protein BGW36DRAFT_353285 [Talaromyces proteolyticus]|uniref:Uncharacterized protein n=1 Tax=Talaromyces proteolyticus TaxID=1131652 RepID=A0AAD4L1E8_9EURO|nr:uncharacterized protein BGW36DRAFT_353285 [Talaromyces proteolyticus]KAH8704841.1 hypothetical protein BGW36DRAFT_353285 [Talaromyces proteolyticus]